MVSAADVIVEVGDLVTASGRFVKRRDGDWLDVARADDLLDRSPDWKSRSSFRVFGARADEVPQAFEGRTVKPQMITVTGMWTGESIEVQSQSRNVSAWTPAARWTNPPCPAPAGGWPPLSGQDFHGIEGLEDLRASGAAVTVVHYRPSPDTEVLVVAAEDIERVNAVLRRQFPNNLCIVRSRWTRQQLDGAWDYARERWDDWRVETIKEPADEVAQCHISICLLRVRPDIAAWADSQPEGLVTFEPILQRVRRSADRDQEA